MMQRLQKLERKLATEAVTEVKVTEGRQWINDRRPSQKKVAEAVEQLQQLRKGKTLGNDVTIKQLINEGRH